MYPSVSVREEQQRVPWKVRGVGDSKACAVGIGSRQSSESTSWAKVTPAEGLKLIRKRIFASQRWDALNFLQADRDLC